MFTYVTCTFVISFSPNCIHHFPFVNNFIVVTPKYWNFTVTSTEVLTAVCSAAFYLVNYNWIPKNSNLCHLADNKKRAKDRKISKLQVAIPMSTCQSSSRRAGFSYFIRTLMCKGIDQDVSDCELL